MRLDSCIISSQLAHQLPFIRLTSADSPARPLALLDAQAVTPPLSQSAHNITDDEKSSRQIARPRPGLVLQTLLAQLGGGGGGGEQAYSEASSLLALALFYSLASNAAVPAKFVDSLRPGAAGLADCGRVFVDRLVGIVGRAVEAEFTVRLVTLELAINLIKKVSRSSCLLLFVCILPTRAI